jgi:hypothetical protein
MAAVGIPAAIISASISRESLAGPMVATILVLRRLSGFFIEFRLGIVFG